MKIFFNDLIANLIVFKNDNVYLQFNVRNALAEIFPSLLKAIHMYFPISSGFNLVNVNVPATLGNTVLFPSFFQMILGAGTPCAWQDNVVLLYSLIFTSLSLGRDTIVGATV